MILLLPWLWSRWFESREYRRALRISDDLRYEANQNWYGATDAVVALIDQRDQMSAEIRRLEGENKSLRVDLDAARLAVAVKPAGMGDIVPAVTTEALGSRDRANVLRLSDENERLRAVAERCEKEHR